MSTMTTKIKSTSYVSLLAAATMVLWAIPALIPSANAFAGVRARSMTAPTASKFAPQGTRLTYDSASGGQALVSTRTTTTPTTALASSAAAVAAALAPGPMAASAILPTSLGFWKMGYAVSYGYGGAMLASGLVQLFGPGATAAMAPPLKCHAALYVLYGVRLCLFLLNREIKLPAEIHQMKQTEATLVQRFKRLPLLLAISGLFYMMAAAPMKIVSMHNPATTVANAATLALGGVGFGLAAVGDWYKSKIKARDGRDALVTTGPFKYLRHPNYTGEMLGWTSLCLAMPALSFAASPLRRRMLPWMAASAVGWAGIVFSTLAGEATAGLEKKQREKYGGTPEYEEWIKTSWSGPMIGG